MQKTLGWILVTIMIAILYTVNSISPFANVLEHMSNLDSTPFPLVDLTPVSDSEETKSESVPAAVEKGEKKVCFESIPASTTACTIPPEPPREFQMPEIVAHNPRPRVDIVDKCVTPKVEFPPVPPTPIQKTPMLERSEMGPDIDPSFDSTKEELYCPSKPPQDPYVEPPPEKRPAPYGYVYLSDQYWRIPRTYAHEYAQNPSCPIYAQPTVGMPLDAVEYQRGVGTIMPDFAFKTL